MTTIVTGRRARSVSSDTFAAITDAALIGVTADSLTFDGGLTAEQQAAIQQLAGTPETANPAARASLLAALEAHGDDCPLAAAVACYLLGVGE